MVVLNINRKRIFILLAFVAALVLLTYVPVDLSGRGRIYEKVEHGILGRPDPSTIVDENESDDSPLNDEDAAILNTETSEWHPVSQLRRDADRRWRVYETSLSRTFKQTVNTYRRNYGRHPPPGFKKWYKFARDRNVFNVDDFDQIMDDLRPFWAIEPKIIRQHAAHLSEKDGGTIAGIHIRNHKVVKMTNPKRRSEVLKAQLIDKFVQYLPDMDIAVNTLDQPRIVVPWEDMQDMLAKEQEKRRMFPPLGVTDEFTKGQSFLLDTKIVDPKDDPSERLDADWFSRSGRQYMDVASLACPPESPARSGMSDAEADRLYKHSLGGIITNFNRSSDLCIVGPSIQNQHGLLFAATSLVVSKKLLPVFGECKVNVNSEILFPANKYYESDPDYEFSADEDLSWEDKKDFLLWLGASSGGTHKPQNYKDMHRSRLVQLLNSTNLVQEDKRVTVLNEVSPASETPTANATYDNHHEFDPAHFAQEHAHAAFTEIWGCDPGDCSFMKDDFATDRRVPFEEQFRNKYLIDVDGHSFSGRWYPFLKSKSLGLKATILREWHDSRLFAWRHFIPVDNHYDDLYALLTYFIGYGKSYAGDNLGEDDADNADQIDKDGGANAGVYIPQHDREARTIARQGREWARKALRREDMEVYMFRLLLEYGRVIDDHRDHIGYARDGSEVDQEWGQTWGEKMGGWTGLWRG